jgi:hypothetical protein
MPLSPIAMRCGRRGARLATLPAMHDEVHPFAVPIMQATLEEFARITEKKAANLEAKIAETALVEGSA